MNYKLWIEGEAKGPCTLEDLRVMWEEGDIDGQTLYAEEGSEKYTPLAGLAGALNIASPEEALIPSIPPPVETPAPVQNAVVKNPEKACAKSIPLLAIYVTGAFALGAGVVLPGIRDQNGNMLLDSSTDFSLIRIGVLTLLIGYLCDLLAQCLFELREANRWWRKK